MKKIIFLVSCFVCTHFSADAQTAEKIMNPAKDTKPSGNPTGKTKPEENVVKAEVVLLKDPPSSAVINIPSPPLPKPLMTDMQATGTKTAPAEIKKPVKLQEQPKQQ